MKNKKLKNMNTINIEGKNFTVDQLKELIKNSEAQKTELQKAIEFLGEKDEDVINFRAVEHLSKTNKLLAFQSLSVIIKYLNKGRIKENGEKFYYLWFYTNPFRFVDVSWNGSYAGIPASLCFVGENAEENANYASKNEEIFKYYEICF